MTGANAQAITFQTNVPIVFSVAKRKQIGANTMAKMTDCRIVLLLKL